MTGPIINPIWFYLAGVGGTLRFILIALGIISAAFLGIFAIVTIDEIGDVDYSKKIVKKIPIALLVLFLGALIPSKETVYTMMVASCATYENVDTVAESVKDGAEWIVEQINNSKRNNTNNNSNNSNNSNNN